MADDRVQSRKKRKPDIKVWIILLESFLLALVVVLAIVWHMRSRAEMKQLRESVTLLETELQDKENEIQQLSEIKEKEAAADIAPEETEIITEPETEEDILPEETEEETEPETEPVYLENLDEYHPGDIIDPEKIDFDDISKYYTIYEISPNGRVFSRINGKSYRENNDISLSSLRYIQLLHYNYDGKIQLGEIIVNKAIAEDIVEIFKELFRNEYEIQSMRLIDDYWTGDPDSSDSASIDVNNTSAFCYRSATGGNSLSKHAYGRAIDINPQQNPYVSYKSGEPKWSHKNADPYIDRNSGLEHVITHEDLAFKLFTQHGFTWGGDWSSIKDYQHFEKAQ